jgi:hypothetical protein
MLPRSRRALPFSAKAGGEVLLLVKLPVKPTVTVPPGDIEGSWDAFVTLTDSPDCVKEPFHSCVTFWLPGNVQSSAQPLTGAGPVFVITAYPGSRPARREGHPPTMADRHTC